MPLAGAKIGVTVLPLTAAFGWTVPIALIGLSSTAMAIALNPAAAG